MVLQVKAGLTDKDGKALSLNDDVYLHHLVVVNSARVMSTAPLLPTGLSCSGGFEALASMLGFGPKAGNGQPPKSAGNTKRTPQAGSSGPGRFSIFVAKGNEGDTNIYSPINTTDVKSGYWLGNNDRISAIIEAVNYKNTTQDVYLTFDMEYLSFPSRPKEYLDVGFGVIMTEDCGSIDLRTPFQPPCGFFANQA
jgi:hypothetical protein